VKSPKILLYILHHQTGVRQNCPCLVDVRPNAGKEDVAPGLEFLEARRMSNSTGCSCCIDFAEKKYCCSTITTSSYVVVAWKHGFPSSGSSRVVLAACQLTAVHVRYRNGVNNENVQQNGRHSWHWFHCCFVGCSARTYGGK
jgi:hypothetical protein